MITLRISDAKRHLMNTTRYRRVYKIFYRDHVKPISVKEFCDKVGIGYAQCMINLLNLPVGDHTDAFMAIVRRLRDHRRHVLQKSGVCPTCGHNNRESDTLTDTGSPGAISQELPS